MLLMVIYYNAIGPVLLLIAFGEIWMWKCTE